MIKIQTWLNTNYQIQCNFNLPIFRRHCSPAVYYIAFEIKYLGEGKLKDLLRELDLSPTCLPEGETSICARQKEERMCLHKLVVYKSARNPRRRINGYYERRIRNWARLVLARSAICVRRVSEITTSPPRYHKQMFSQCSGAAPPGERDSRSQRSIFQSAYLHGEHRRMRSRAFE
jgi:hypothetical protein